MLLKYISTHSLKVYNLFWISNMSIVNLWQFLLYGRSPTYRNKGLKVSRDGLEQKLDNVGVHVSLLPNLDIWPNRKTKKLTFLCNTLLSPAAAPLDMGRKSKGRKSAFLCTPLLCTISCFQACLTGWGLSQCEKSWRKTLILSSLGFSRTVVP